MIFNEYLVRSNTIGIGNDTRHFEVALCKTDADVCCGTPRLYVCT